MAGSPAMASRRPDKRALLRCQRSAGCGAQRYLEFARREQHMVDDSIFFAQQLRHIGREIGIAFVGADDNAAGLGDREIAAGHPGVGGEDRRTDRVALRFRQVVHVAVVGVDSDRLGEHLRDVCAIVEATTDLVAVGIADLFP